MSFAIVATAVSATATLGSAAISSRSAKKAAQLQAEGTASAIGEQQRQFDLTREDFAPYRETGINALRQLVGDIDRAPTSAEVMSDPGYQFGLEQGQRGIDRKIAAGGGRVSGRAIMAAGRFGTDYASGMYGAAYQRRQDRLNRMAALAGVGQTATGASAAAGANASNAISNLYASQGDASGARQLAQGSIWGNAASQIGAQFGRVPQTPQKQPYAWNIDGGWTGEH